MGGRNSPQQSSTWDSKVREVTTDNSAHQPQDSTSGGAG